MKNRRARNRRARKECYLNNLERNLTNLCLELYAPEYKKLIEPLVRKGVYEPHAKMQLVCSKYLMDRGYTVEVEKPVGDGALVCDVYGTKDGERLIIEIESGSSSVKREASKAARYSKYADTFVLGIPYYRDPKIPKELLKKPESRDEEKLKKIKKDIGKKYKNPPVELDDLLTCHVDLFYKIDMKGLEVKEKNPTEYL